MFERFTDRSRRVVVLAQEEARLLGHTYIGTEHILLGLISERDGLAAQALGLLDISLEAVRNQIEEIIGQGASSPSGHIPFTPRAKKALELSLREALQLGHNYIGTEHILLGLIREGEGVAAQVLVQLGADLPRVRQQVLALLSGQTAMSTLASRTGEGRSPAALRADRMARSLAQGGQVGSHHLLLALLADERSVAARVLASLGVSREAVEERLATVGVAGTSDETPEEAGARRMRLKVAGDRLEISVDDPELVRGLRELVVSGSDPAAARFPELWKALQATTRDLVRRFEAEPEWQAEGWNDTTVAGYVVRSEPDAPVGRLTVSSSADVDEAEIRALLASWAQTAPETQPRVDRGCASFSVVVDRVGPDGDLVVEHLRVGRATSRKDAPKRSLRDLLAFAATDLRASAS